MLLVLIFVDDSQEVTLRVEVEGELKGVGKGLDTHVSSGGYFNEADLWLGVFWEGKEGKEVFVWGPLEFCNSFDGDGLFVSVFVGHELHRW